MCAPINILTMNGGAALQAMLISKIMGALVITSIIISNFLPLKRLKVKKEKIEARR